MKRLLLSAFLLSVAAVSAQAFMETVDPNQTGPVIVSTSPVTPTLLFISDPNAVRTYIINTSSANVFLSFESTTSTSTPQAFSISPSTGSFFIPASTTTIAGGATIVPQVWSPDGPTDSFRGPIWAVCQLATCVIERFRGR